MKYFLTICLFLFATGFVQAKDVEIEATGVAEEYDWALMNAIDNAVKQSAGVSVSRDKPMQRFEADSSAELDYKNKESANLSVFGQAQYDSGEVLRGEENARYGDNASVDYQQDTNIKAKAKMRGELKEIDAKYSGKVKSYKVLSSEQKEGKYYVKISATVFQPDEYKSPKLGKKSAYTLSIVPFKGDKQITCLGNKINSASLVKQLNNAITSQIAATKKFNIVDRQNLDAYSEELALVENELTKENEKSRLKNLASADYMLVGMIDMFSATSSTTYIEMTGEKDVNSTARLGVSYKLIETATMEVISSSSAEEKIRKNGSFSSCGSVEKELVRQIAKSATNQIMEDLFPDYKPKEVKKSKKAKSKAPAEAPVITLPFD